MIVSVHAKRWRKAKDIIRQSTTYLFASLGVVVLAAIIIFVLTRGAKLLSFDLLTSNFAAQTYVVDSSVTYEVDHIGTYELPDHADKENVYFSSRWGVAFEDTTDKEGGAIVKIAYVAPGSPFLSVNDKGSESALELTTKMHITKIMYDDIGGTLGLAFSKDGAESMAISLDKAQGIRNMTAVIQGGGIRGSLLSTIYMIGVTLLIALPLGIGSAIYLSEFAPNNKLTAMITAMIDMTAGIPSIIFGFVGGMVFVPLFNNGKYSLMAGTLTLTIMLLPTIIRTTTEALRAVPQSLRSGSLALGASEVQTTFRVVLPNAVGGILTSILLSIGRIIGESAALILTIGTAVSDAPSLGKSGTTLAVHIWSIMGGETPNVALACAISIIILLTVLILSLLTKLVSAKLNRWGENA